MKQPISLYALLFLCFSWITTKSWSLVGHSGPEYFRIIRQFGPGNVLSNGVGLFDGVMLLGFAAMVFYTMILSCYFGKQFKDLL